MPCVLTNINMCTYVARKNAQLKLDLTQIVNTPFIFI